jgi:hypothetical protein
MHQHVDMGTFDNECRPVHFTNDAAEIRKQFRLKLRFDQRARWRVLKMKWSKCCQRCATFFFAPSGLSSSDAHPTACAVGCILSPLRG